MKMHLMALSLSLALVSPGAVPFKIGIAGHTFNRRTMSETVDIMKRIDCHYLCHKEAFLPYDASQEEVDAWKAQMKAEGISVLATGPLYAKDEATARKQFEFAKRLGIKTLVGVPYSCDPGVVKDHWGPHRFESEETLDMIERLVREFDMRYAIHNHGPDMPRLYPTAESVMKRIEHRDRRIGVCLDIGHERRAGFDPAAFVRAHSDRIYDVHIKNIKIDPAKNRAVEAPRGELDIVSVFRALSDVGYTGVCHIEYEKDFEDNAMGLAESLGYFRGIADAVGADVK